MKTRTSKKKDVKSQPSRTIKSHQEPSNIESEKLEKIYKDLSSTPNYSAKIAEFLKKNQNHSVHRRIVRKTFPRRRIITHYPFELFQGDLIEYSKNDYAYANKGHRYILILIDCFSKMVYAAPVKRKNADYMSLAFEQIFRNFNEFPTSLVTDRGLEFYNSKVQNVFTQYGINHYSTKTKTDWKASMAERVIRTLKSRLQKYFYQNKTKKWIDFLPQLVTNYNSTPHRTIGMAPNQVTDQNSPAIYKRVFGDIDIRVKPRLKVGDKVRILSEKTLFEKGYTRNWSEEIYTVGEILQKAGIVWYKIVDSNGKTLPGIKYYWQLNLVSNAPSN